MAKAFTPLALTANALMEGDAVWWTGRDWSPRFDDALIAETPEAADDLQDLAGSGALGGDVVGVYVFAVTLTEAGAVPTARREAIRAERAPTFAYGPAALKDAA